MDHRAVEQQAGAIEREIDALIAEFGSSRAAIRALLHDLTVLADDMNASTSRGYFQKRGNTIIVLLSGGDKSTQQRDIKLAKHLLDEGSE